MDQTANNIDNHEDAIKKNDVRIHFSAVSGGTTGSTSCCGMSNVIVDDNTSCSRTSTTSTQTEEEVVTVVLASDPTTTVDDVFTLDMNPIIKKTTSRISTRSMNFIVSKGIHIVSDIDGFMEDCCSSSSSSSSSSTSSIPDDQESVGDDSSSEDHLSEDFYPGISDDEKDSDYEDSTSRRRTSSKIQARCRRVRSTMYNKIQQKQTQQTKSRGSDGKFTSSSRSPPRKKRGKGTSKIVTPKGVQQQQPPQLTKQQKWNQEYSTRGLDLAALSAAIMEKEMEEKKRMELQKQQNTMISSHTSHNNNGQQLQQTKSTFPTILYQMLQDAENQPHIHDIICWSHSGNYFVIKDKLALGMKLLPKYLPNQSHYETFRCALAAYDINICANALYCSTNNKVTLIDSSSPHGIMQSTRYNQSVLVYYHEKLRRHQRDLCYQIQRKVYGDKCRHRRTSGNKRKVASTTQERNQNILVKKDDSKADHGDAKTEIGLDQNQQRVVKAKAPPNTFVFVLYQMLDDALKSKRMSSIISWTQNGRQFIVKDRTEFEQFVLPKYLNGQGKYASFHRALNKHKFTFVKDFQLKKRQKHYTFEHTHFIRGRLDLLHMVTQGHEIVFTPDIEHLQLAKELKEQFDAVDPKLIRKSHVFPLDRMTENQEERNDKTKRIYPSIVSQTKQKGIEKEVVLARASTTATTATNKSSVSSSSPSLFLSTLYAILEESDRIKKLNKIICWSSNGKEFILKDKIGLEHYVLPKYLPWQSLYRSFSTALREHQFTKSPVIASSSSNTPKPITFSHQDFIRGQPDLFCRIIRIKQTKINALANSTREREINVSTPKIKKNLPTEVPVPRTLRDTCQLQSEVKCRNSSSRVRSTETSEMKGNIIEVYMDNSSDDGKTRSQSKKRKFDSILSLQNGTTTNAQCFNLTTHTLTSCEFWSDNDVKNLLFKPVFQKYLAIDGSVKEAYGILCSRAQRSSITYYMVDFFSSFESMKRNLVYYRKHRDEVSKERTDDVTSYNEICELTATSMAIAFRQHKRDICTVSKPYSNHHYNWITPIKYNKRQMVSQGKKVPCITLHLADVKLTLFVGESRIANAGLGLFAYYEPISKNCINSFSLKPGQLVDLGVYGPFNDNEQRKPEYLMMTKNFIHNWKCENWQFEASKQFNEENLPYIDITDDTTGEPCANANENPYTYANETDGKDYPSLLAQPDPEGRIHYYIGHESQRYGPLWIPLKGKDIPVELKIDYGSGYEKVRFRNRYCRLNKQKRKEMRELVNKEDSWALTELRELDWSEVVDVCRFLQLFYMKRSLIDSEVHSLDQQCRLFIATLVILARILDIKEQQSSSSSRIDDENLGEELRRATICSTNIDCNQVILSLLQEATGVMDFWFKNQDFLEYLGKNPLFRRNTVNILNISQEDASKPYVLRERLSVYLESVQSAL